MLLERRYLHRDISLGNIMFDPRGGDENVGRLIDFDLAKHVEFGSNTSTEGDFRTVGVVPEGSLSVVVVADLCPCRFFSGNTHVPVL